MKIKQKSLSLLLLVGLIATGCTSQPATVEKTGSEAPTPVQVSAAALGVVEEAAGFTGKLAPSEVVQISAKVNGKIKSLNATLGQQVKQGSTLFTLDQTDLMNAVKQAQAGLQVAQASLRQSGSSSSQMSDQAKNSLAQAEQSLADARRDTQRTEELFRQGAVSAQQVEQVRTQLTNAETAYANAKTNVNSAQKMTSVDVSQASLNQARVNLENARQQLANASVQAPITGYISQVSGAVGEIANPGAPILTIVDLDPLLVKVNLSETEVTSVKVGDKAEIQLPALDKKMQGRVSAVSPVMDAQLKSYPIEVSVPNPNNELKADMIANLLFVGKEKQAQSIVVPRKAVFDESGKRYLYRIEGDIAKKIEVTTGQETSDLIEISKGIAAGDQVVVRGQTLLKDGAKIEIQKNN